MPSHNIVPCWCGNRKIADYTSTVEDSTPVISITMVSNYNKPLPGDIVVMFSADRQIPEFPSTIFLALLVAMIFAAAFLLTQTLRRR